jgi:hypothetical protein
MHGALLRVKVRFVHKMYSVHKVHFAQGIGVVGKQSRSGNGFREERNLSWSHGKITNWVVF